MRFTYAIGYGLGVYECPQQYNKQAHTKSKVQKPRYKVLNIGRYNLTLRLALIWWQPARKPVFKFYYLTLSVVHYG